MFNFSRQQIVQAIKAYGKGTPNCYYVMRYKGDNQWAIYTAGDYTPKFPYKPSYIYDYDAYFITDKTGKLLDIMILDTKDCFRERIINAYYTSQHKERNALCISNSFIINNAESFRFRCGFASVMQKGGAYVLIDYSVKGRIFWI